MCRCGPGSAELASRPCFQFPWPCGRSPLLHVLSSHAPSAPDHQLCVGGRGGGAPLAVPQLTPVLTLPAWRECQTPQVRDPALQDRPHLRGQLRVQIVICPSDRWFPQPLTVRSLVRATHRTENRFLIRSPACCKGHDAGAARRKRCTGQRAWEGMRGFPASPVAAL